jgi:CheY-like chemotaxis protein/two-component sensor histidine kinase
MNRIMSGKLRLDIERVDLAAVIAAALDSIRPAADAKGITVHCGPAPVDIPLNGDPARLQQVIWNLLSNAVKFTQAGGHLQVALERAGTHVTITVRDDGCGIDAKFLPHVFERFRQADASAARQQGGLGLGLSIARQLVELHGGSIAAASDGDGKGSTFTVRLPLDMRLPISAKPSEPAVVPPPIEVCVATPNLAGVRVLVVDDEPDARDMVRRLLEECDARVVVAASAEEAEAAVKGEQFHVLLSDIGMPIKDGYALIQSLRRDGCTVPAAALTAFVRPEDRARALRAGYQVHLTKPLEPAKLLATVAALLGKTAELGT